MHNLSRDDRRVGQKEKTHFGRERRSGYRLDSVRRLRRVVSIRETMAESGWFIVFHGDVEIRTEMVSISPTNKVVPWRPSGPYTAHLDCPSVLPPSEHLRLLPFYCGWSISFATCFSVAIKSARQPAQQRQPPELSVYDWTRRRCSSLRPVIIRRPARTLKMPLHLVCQGQGR